MNHVPNGRDGRKTARDGSQVPMKKNSQGRDPGPVEENSSANGKWEKFVSRSVVV